MVLEKALKKGPWISLDTSGGVPIDGMEKWTDHRS